MERIIYVYGLNLHIGGGDRNVILFCFMSTSRIPCDYIMPYYNNNNKHRIIIISLQFTARVCFVKNNNNNYRDYLCARAY